MFATQLAKANHVSELRGLTKFVTMQNHYNLLYREEEREMNRYCASEGIGVRPICGLMSQNDLCFVFPLLQLLPWSPLARGFLSGGRTRDQAGGKQTGTARAASDTYADSYYNKSEDFDVIDCVRAVAEKRGISMSQVRRRKGDRSNGPNNNNEKKQQRHRCRWPGCSAGPGSSRPSSAPQRCRIWRRRPRASRSVSRRTRSRCSRASTSRTPSLGISRM